VAFESPIRIDQETPLGRVDVAFIDSENVLVCWIEDDGLKAIIKYRTVSINGNFGEVMTLTTIDASRASGFPQMANLNGKIHFAWTTMENEKVSIKTKIISL